VATFRCETWAGAPDKYAKDLFVHHAAGAAGIGGSSYNDDVILRDADESTVDGGLPLPNWTGNVGGTDTSPEDRLFYLQNWRADGAVTLRPAVDAESNPDIVDTIRYSAYGVPSRASHGNATRIGGADLTPDGQYDVDDIIAFANWSGAGEPMADIVGAGGPPQPRGDGVTVDDIIAFVNAFGDQLPNGPGVLSTTRSRKGYAGLRVRPGVGVRIARRHAGLVAVAGAAVAADVACPQPRPRLRVRPLDPPRPARHATGDAETQRPRRSACRGRWEVILMSRDQRRAISGDAEPSRARRSPAAPAMRGRGSARRGSRGRTFPVWDLG
jgi:hypothetical protein